MVFIRQILLLCAIFVSLESAGLQNPCPDIFQYELNGTKWQGIIKVSNLPKTIIKLHVKLSIATILPSKYSGEIRLLDRKENLFQSIKNKGILHYKVIFPIHFPVPVVTLITINDRKICTGPPAVGAFVTSISLENTLFLRSQTLSSNPDPNKFKMGPNSGPRTLVPDTRHFHTTTPTSQLLNLFPSRNFRPSPTDEPAINFSKNRSPFLDICGVPIMTKPLIVNGNPSHRASYPWLGAVFVQTELGISFMCGGNLISKKHVVTAAHCIKLSVEGPIQNPEDFLIMLGKYKIKKFNEPGSIISEVLRIDIHPEHKLETADADLAVLTLLQEIEFTSVIRPICLFPEPLDLQDLVGEMGTIAGWGRDEFGNRMTTEVRETSVKIVSQETCLRSHVAFRDITSDRTFCAGGESNGAGPCTGDSGGGLLVSKDEKWYLRGIISRSLVEKGNTLGCDTFSFSVFVDVTKFADWLNNFIQQ